MILRLRSAVFAIVASVLCITAAHQAQAASAAEIDAKATAILERFYKEVGGAKALGDKANGILVFPEVVKAGFGIGGEYGEGALRIAGKTADYYSTAAASIGLQIGVQAKAVIIMFLTDRALKSFRASDGWEVGVDGSVALITLGAGGAIDSNSVKDPVVGFIFDNKGLMANLTLEGAKMSRIDR